MLGYGLVGGMGNEWTDYEPMESTAACQPDAEALADAEETREGFLTSSMQGS
jgi:hypothetical protein